MKLLLRKYKNGVNKYEMFLYYGSWTLLTKIY